MRISDWSSDVCSSDLRDVEAGLPREAVGDAAERTDDVAQRPVVHVDDPPPAYPAQVDAKLVAPIDMVVDQRGEQVVRRSDGAKIDSEVEEIGRANVRNPVTNQNHVCRLLHDNK